MRQLKDWQYLKLNYDFKMTTVQNLKFWTVCRFFKFFTILLGSTIIEKPHKISILYFYKRVFGASGISAISRDFWQFKKLFMTFLLVLKAI